MYEQDSEDQRLEQLSEQAASEKDPKKFIELIGELNILLKEKRSSASDKKVDWLRSNNRANQIGWFPW